MTARPLLLENGKKRDVGRRYIIFVNFRYKPTFYSARLDSV